MRGGGRLPWLVATAWSALPAGAGGNAFDDLLLLSGACDGLNELNGLMFRWEGKTANDAPWFKALGAEEYIYYDGGCSEGVPGRWIIDTDAPSLTAMKDLDEDTECRYQGRLDSNDTSGPPAHAVWWLLCDLIWEDHLLMYTLITTTTTTSKTSSTTSSTTSTSTTTASETSTTTTTLTTSSSTTTSSTSTSTASTSTTTTTTSSSTSTTTSETSTTSSSVTSTSTSTSSSITNTSTTSSTQSTSSTSTSSSSTSSSSISSSSTSSSSTSSTTTASSSSSTTSSSSTSFTNTSTTITVSETSTTNSTTATTRTTVTDTTATTSRTTSTGTTQTVSATSLTDTETSTTTPNATTSTTTTTSSTLMDRDGDDSDASSSTTSPSVTTTTSSASTTTSTSQGPMQGFIINGACPDQDFLNGLYFERQGFAANGAPVYGSGSGYYIYYDMDCNGRGEFKPRWIIDQDKPNTSRSYDLDSDNECLYLARVDSSTVMRPPTGALWHMYCERSFKDAYLTFQEQDQAPTTTVTATPVIPEAPKAIVVSGACLYQEETNGLFLLAGATATGAPYYKGKENSYYIYWDPDCSGKNSIARWVIDNDAPNATAASDLDGDKECKYLARANSEDFVPPEGATWLVFCGGASWRELTLQLQATDPDRQGAIDASSRLRSPILVLLLLLAVSVA